MNTWRRGDSAPYLILARTLRVPYEHVLGYEGYLSKRTPRILADDKLDTYQERLVMDVWLEKGNGRFHESSDERDCYRKT